MLPLCNSRPTHLCGLALERDMTQELLQHPDKVIDEFARKGRRISLIK